MRFIRHAEPFQNVVATGRATLNSILVLGNIVERLYLVLGGTTFTKAMITALRVKLNGKVVFGDISGAQLDSFQTYQLGNTGATFLTVDFIEPDSKSMQGEILGAIDTNAAGVNTFTVEVDIAGATAPTLDSWIQLRDVASITDVAGQPTKGFNPNLRPLLRALIPTSIAALSAAEQQYAINYGSGGNSLIKRLIMFNGTASLSTFRAKRNSLDIYEFVVPTLASWVQSDYGKHPQAGMYVVDWLADGNQSDTQPTRNSDGTLANYQWLITTAGAGTMQLFADVYTILAGV
jgi:Viral coat protein P2 N-terminal domain